MANPGPTSGFGRFFAELRRRHVVRVAIAYGAVGFVALQAAEIVLPAFLPGFEADAALRVVVVAFLVLFPIVVALAWVYEITPQGVRAMEALDAEAGRPPTGSLVPRLALLGFTVLAAGSAGMWWYRTDAAALEQMEQRRAARSSPFVAAATTDASGPIRSLAVLPLEDYSDEAEGAYFAAGMHEALISQLSQLGSFRVISRTSTEGYRTEGKSLPQIGSELGVDAIVEGSVLRADGRVRITVQLIHAASDSHLWASDYERELEDVIGLQREVATAIASEIDSQLGDDTAPAPSEVAEAVSVESAAPVAPEVQDFVMRGRFALRGAGDSAADEAERYFEEALSLDSTFVPALTGLAGARLVHGLEIEGPEALRELSEARAIAARAVAADSASVEAQEILVSTEEALAEFAVRIAQASEAQGGVVRVDGDSVVVLALGDTARLSVRGDFLSSATELGRFVQTELASRRSGRTSEEDELRSIGRLELAGRQDQALARALAAVERFPESGRLWDAAERLSVSTGGLGEVVGLRRDRVDALGAEAGPDLDGLEARVDAEGVEGYWRWKIEELDAREQAGLPVSLVDRAAAHSAIGNVDPAIDLLEESLQQRDPRLISLRTDPVWDPLRSHERFQGLLRSLSPRGRRPSLPSRPVGRN